MTDAQLIIGNSGFVPGQKVNSENIQQAIHQVYGLKLFDDVKVLGEQQPGGIHLIIKVVEAPRLDKLVFKGNEDIKEEDFKLDLKRGQTITPDRLKDAESAIRKAYREKGFFLVNVKPQMQPTTVVGEADAVFEIEENKPVTVEAIIFDSARQLSHSTLQKKMQNKPRSFLKSIFGGGKFNREKYTEDKTAIIDTYKKNGFLDAILVSDTIILNESRTKVTLKFEVNEGPKYYFGSTTFSGQQVFTEEKLRRTLEYKQGDVFDQESFEKSIGNIYQAYQEDGYLYARVIEDTKTIDSVVNVSCEVSEGVPAHVHRINIEGNVKTKDKVIRRELAIYPGEVFHRSSLMRSLRNVMALNYFANVTPDYKVLPDGQVDLMVKVEEKPTGQIQVGAGYSGTDKLVGTISLGIPNLGGNGQDASLSVDFGARRQSYSIGLTEPWFLDTPTTVGFDLYNTTRDVDLTYIAGSTDYTEKRKGFDLRFGRRLRWPDDYFRVYADYRLESTIAKDFSTGFKDYFSGQVSSLDKQPWPQTTSATSFTVQRDSRDLPEFAEHGSRSSYQIEFAGGALGGLWSYVKHTVSYAHYSPIFKGLTFAPSWKLTAIQGDAGVNAVPYLELLSAGGIRSDGTIRGYDDGVIQAQLLSDTTGKTRIPGLIRGGFIGGQVPGGYVGSYSRYISYPGRALAIMNAELTFPVVKEQIHGLLFFDAGNVWTDLSLIKPFSNLYTSYGFGFRLTVPGMGTLGFDFGIPLRGSGKGRLKPHFQFGGNF
ncbi:MAG: outer membrane protein assembly factor BamA [candidate division Zixibacteria bacterium]|nr:outer membrane protein assembly factor BamA [candidate division Zixibacteria bacterium]